MTGSRRSTAFTIRISQSAASGPGASFGWSRNASAAGCPSSISAIGSPTARRWPTSTASRRSNAWTMAAGSRSPGNGGRRPRFRDFRRHVRHRCDARIFGDEAFLARCVEVEAALARAQGRLGIIPAEAAEAITQAASAFANGERALDLARLKRETETVGYPILPLVRQLAERAGDLAAACIGERRPRTSWIPPWCCRSAPGSR